MTPIITYSLRLGTRDFDGYYRTIAAFAERWIARATRAAGPVIAGFRDYRRARGEVDRSDVEYAFELLALGVMLHEHGPEALRWPAGLTRLLSWLVAAQDRWPWSESIAKGLRGWLGWIGRSQGAGAGGGEDVGRLIAWLRANGESARADRLAQWQAYCEAAGPRAARSVIAQALALAADFAAESSGALGQFTEGVERFLAAEAPKRRRRYDAEFVSRSRLEYHLGLLGTEVLSRAYRGRFLAARRKIVIVPPCMRAQSEDKCKAIETPLGAKCQACTPSCRVHQITRLGEKHGFEVFIIPDELRGIGAEAGRAVEGVGLVGVSCALTNWSGGWEADALGVPAQGVLLDYVGCTYHWDESGVTTDTNLRKLQEVLQIRRGESGEA